MSLIDSLRKRIAEDALGRVTDPRPLFAAAGAADLAFEFVRGVPDRLEKVADSVREEWTAERFGDAFTDLVDGANIDDLRARGQQLRDQVASTLKDRRDSVVDDLADLSADARDLPTQIRAKARQAPGRAAVEVANQVGAAFEAYDTCVDRGKIVVARLRGDAAPGRTPSPENRLGPLSGPGSLGSGSSGSGRPGAPTTDAITPVTRPRPPVSPSSVESTPPVKPAVKTPTVRRATPGAATTGAVDAAAPVKRAAAKRAAARTSTGVPAKKATAPRAAKAAAGTASPGVPAGAPGAPTAGRPTRARAAKRSEETQPPVG
jgi:hypothetical protein